MDPNPPGADDETDIDREIRIGRMKWQIEEIAEGEIFSGIIAPISPQVEEAFLEHILAYEQAELDTDFNRLLRRGVVMPPAAELDDKTLRAKLWEIINELAEMRCFLHDTNHLSDRALYDWLWSSGLREETPSTEGIPDSAWHTSPIGGGDDGDTAIWLKYYATEEERHEWHANYPLDPLPAREAVPFDRDKGLPNRRGF
jgi:hypothetical protein